MGNKLFASGVRRVAETHLWCPKCGTRDNPSFSTRFTFNKKKLRYGVECAKCKLATDVDYVDLETARESWIALGKIILEKKRLNRPNYNNYYDDDYQEGRALDYHERMFEIYGDMDGHGMYGSMLDP